MSDAPDNLVLIQLREMRHGDEVSREAVVTAMNAAQRVFTRLEQFNDEIAWLRGEVLGLRTEIADFRDGTRKNFIGLEGDLITVGNQNISRHGETINLLGRVGDLERSTP